MKREDFSVGLEFWMSGRRFRCTDIGQRVIVAIMLDDRADQTWFAGPPYAVQELVIDEWEMALCTLVEDARVTRDRADADKRRQDETDRSTEELIEEWSSRYSVTLTADQELGLADTLSSIRRIEQAEGDKFWAQMIRMRIQREHLQAQYDSARKHADLLLGHKK